MSERGRPARIMKIDQAMRAGRPLSDMEHRGWHSRGYLPHFDSPELVQMVTFWLVDSLPQGKIEGWKADRRCKNKRILWNVIENYLDGAAGLACYGSSTRRKKWKMRCSTSMERVIGCWPGALCPITFTLCSRWWSHSRLQRFFTRGNHSPDISFRAEFLLKTVSGNPIISTVLSAMKSI